MQVRSDNVAEASPRHISPGLTFPAYSLCSGYGIFFVPADQSGAGKTYDLRLVLPSDLTGT